ncbi:hypothetical protein C5Z25_08065 [Lactobacillus sp. CBA3605]|uniref:CPBP family intramembrane glutamic endopeptidase n=1 Tax=Lactobacillus sp. CBA3605 TaxID=2099788 RepID=UPI000CFAB4A9|nr:CPBP family intramembrane glutamic endopeptidase [Lactobacillus sp. CBA3605]AVK61735.1 hypothetical protein C5Z25_08065 [Lactobacillus sp. CBA3605]
MYSSQQQPWKQALQLLPALIFLLLPVSQNYVHLFQLDFKPIIFLYFGYILLIGITEEYVYRGVLLPLLGRALPHRPMTAIIIDSLLFGMSHVLVNSHQLALNYVIPQALYAAVCGLLLCGVYLKTRNLILPMLLHALSDVGLVVQFMTHTHTQRALTFSAQTTVISLILTSGFFIIVAAVVYWQIRHVTIEEQLLI